MTIIIGEKSWLLKGSEKDMERRVLDLSLSNGVLGMLEVARKNT